MNLTLRQIPGSRPFAPARSRARPMEETEVIEAANTDDDELVEEELLVEEVSIDGMCGVY